MCTVDHNVTARAGYLIDAPMESIASPGFLFSRMLAHHREVGLNCEQIMSLLDLNREYIVTPIVKTTKWEFLRLLTKHNNIE